MTDIKLIYDKIYSDGIQKDPKVFIDIYEENKNLIEGADASISNPDYEGIMRITAEYALSLSQYGSSRKSIPYLDKAIELFKNSSQTDLSKLQMFEMLFWARGMENYNQKKYSLASTDFQYLVNNYPDNDKYRNWLIASKTIKTKKYLNFIWGFAIMGFVWYLMATNERDQNRNYFLGAAIVFGLVAVTVEIKNSLLKSRIKKQ
jgi:tetratricopeptide (TPR) repeat protein